MRRLTLALAVVVLAAGLAGCVGDDGDADQAGTQSARSGAATAADDGAAVSADDERGYGYEASDVHEVRWHNESFSPATCFWCPNSQHRYDVTDMLARGAPTRLDVEVEYEANVFDGTGVYLAADGAEIYHQNGTFDTVSGVVAPHGGTVEVVVYNVFPDANTEIGYELRIEATANRSGLPAHVPVAFSTPQDPAELVVDGTELGTDARLMLWDGDDAFLGHHAIEGETEIDLSEAAGDEAVAYLAGTEGLARLRPANATAADTTMRPLTLTTGEAREPIPNTGQVEIAAPIETVPLQAGLFVEGSFDGGTEFSGELTADGETVLAYASAGYLTGSDSRYVWWGEPGHPALDDADYLGTMEFSAASGGDAGVVWLNYER